jgi:dihydrofolate synthase/folylpolyglutamate synthase
VIGAQADDVYNLLFNKCDEMNSPSFSYEYDFYAEKISNGFQYLSRKFNIDLPLPSLKGDHQIQNAASVVAAIMLLNDKFNITAPQIAGGLLAANWPGRLQLVNEDKTKKLAGDNIEIYLDGAHNAAGALCLSNWIKDNLTGNVYLVIGMTRNRDVATFCSFFQDCTHGGAAVTVESEPSSYSASVLAAKAQQSNIILVEDESLTKAIQLLSILNNKQPATIIVTGSLFLVSDFLKL